ncbi:hypothetical protein DPMN_090159 [Dreissena polymorpha]|uniref:BHLH domain-containing protein n=1 Tax=Dreissena polymorpha TaxID=45954 RepID=A0A9D4KZ71_DREPO|nr:hypothetical protein DPMN_090159 [Dreissena polymorpha]
MNGHNMNGFEDSMDCGSDSERTKCDQNGKPHSKLTRGEKSRIAAKCRRDKENIAMNDLISELPIADSVLQKMDKAAVIKLAICYLKIKHFVQKVTPDKGYDKENRVVIFRPIS